MGRIITFDEGRVAYSYATHADLERTGAHPDECDGLIDIVRSVEGSEVALFLKEAGMARFVAISVQRRTGMFPEWLGALRRGRS